MTNRMVQTPGLGNFTMTNAIQITAAMLAVIALGDAWGLVVGGAGSSRAAQKQARAAESSQESSGTALGEPKATQDTPKITRRAFPE